MVVNLKGWLGLAGWLAGWLGLAGCFCPPVRGDGRHSGVLGGQTRVQAEALGAGT